MKKEERKLTEKELKRKDAFEKVRANMEQNGFQTKELTLGVVQANIAALFIMLPFVLFFTWIYYTVNPLTESSQSLRLDFVFLAVLIVLVVLHEAIHGLTWGFFAKNHLKSIDFGVIWKMLTPYCTCNEALTKWQYILGGAMPTIILGFGLSLIATALCSRFLFVLAFIMIFAGGGDFCIILKILLYRPKGKEVVYYDHPYECGLVIFEKE